MRENLPPGMAIAVAATWVIGFCVIDAGYVLAEHISAGRIAIACLCFAAMLWAQLTCTFPSLVQLSARTRYWLLGIHAVLAFAVIPLFGEAMLGMTPLAAGSVLILLPRRLAWPVFAVVLAAEEVSFLLIGLRWDIVFATVEFLLDTLVIFVLSRFVALVAEVHHSRSELTRLAVSTERLRFSSDLHDLLGYSLSTIAVKCELTTRLIPRNTERARGELTEILGTARQALADVRTVARGYRDLSLADEAHSARTMLIAAGIEATIQVDPTPLPADTDTVLATVLREALTNMLRHSKAEHCTITTTRTTEHIELRITNDGTPERPSTDRTGTGLDSLTTRLHRLNGSLTTDRHDNHFELLARIPLTRSPVTTTAPTPAPRSTPTLAPRTATLLVLGILAGYLIQGVSYMYSEGLALDQLALGSLLVALSVGLQLWQTFPNASRRFPLRHPYTVLALQITVALAPFSFLGLPWMGEAGLAAGAALMVLPRTAAWTTFAVLSVASEFIRIRLGENSPTQIVYLLLLAPMTGLVLFGLSQLKDVIAEVHRSRAELSELAVTAERLRFSRDLHNLLGDNLSSISLKCELANHLITRDTTRAQQEVAEVLGTARRALADVRTVARTYRPASEYTDAVS
ncbi:sensor histidine kinase [Streptacidiphilus albus]|uniref:sensor histidine kinase n=1 Tax=Streptacidiphilus albus TaxID=105425 RepID=UPI00128CAF25|nr:histidine kinase [Streptacidiphilus albus]